MRSSKDIELSIVMPAYLEAENLKNLLPRLHAAVTQLNSSYEVLVVDTQTPMDETQQVCEQFNARYIPRQGGNTYGDAVKSGILASEGKHVIFMDADGSHAPEFIQTLFFYRNQYEIVIASRYVDGGRSDNSFALMLMSRMVNWGYSWVLGIPCKDVSNSFKLYRGDLLRAIPIQFKNFDVVEEILYKLLCAFPDIQVIEVPFHFEERKAGTTKRNLLAFVFSYAKSLIKLRLSSSKRIAKSVERQALSNNS